MIDLGLARISRLLQQTPQTWKAIHVAGTNGKGSVTAYVSAMLHAAGKTCARFNSPHLIDRWDCITVNEKPVSKQVFLHAERLVKKRDADNHIGATEFELLTATAFEIMNRENVEFGVIEVGVGGRLDATNAMKQKSVTVITKIGLDHQNLLGKTIEEIALQKAGIMREGVPCVVDDSNPPSVLKVIQDHAKAVGVDVVLPTETARSVDKLSNRTEQSHKIRNIACAWEAFRLTCSDEDTSLQRFLPLILDTNVPGRLQVLTLRRQQPILLDGAHNVQSAEVLADYVDKSFRHDPRGDSRPVTWVLAASRGKDLDGILTVLVRPGDLVTAIQFGPVDGMPWVKAADPEDILHVAKSHGADTFDSGGLTDLRQVLTAALDRDKKRCVVVAGSLYLVSEVLRWLRDNNIHEDSL